MFSVHQCPDFKSQEATNEVNSEWWARLSMVYSQDVQAFTRNFKERRREDWREEKRKEKTIEKEGKEEKREGKVLHPLHHSAVQNNFN